MVAYEPEPRHRCPCCDSPAPHLHPAMQFEGEVQVCPDAYHLIRTNQNTPFLAKVATTDKDASHG